MVCLCDRTNKNHFHLPNFSNCIFSCPLRCLFLLFDFSFSLWSWRGEWTETHRCNPPDKWFEYLLEQTRNMLDLKPCTKHNKNVFALKKNVDKTEKKRRHLSDLCVCARVCEGVYEGSKEVQEKRKPMVERKL